MILLGLALATMAPAHQAAVPPPAPAATASSVQALDPARLAAAKAMIDVIMPPDVREAMVEGMVRPMMANIQQAVLSNPKLEAQLGAGTKARAIFDRFIARQNEQILGKLRAGMPGMFDATTHAYARRFTIEQMRDVSVFFSTPSGRAYMQQSMTIMADPDIQAWQRMLMQNSLSDLDSELATFAAEIEAALTSETAK
jgi:hypothetical protein